jgi:hypothetical protein
MPKLAIGVRLDPEHYERLKRLAEADRRTVGNLAAILIEECLPQRELELKHRAKRASEPKQHE